MLGKIARFEFNYQALSPAFVVIYIVFFLLTFLSVTVDNVTIGGGGNVNINSPYALSQTGLIMSIIGLFIPTALLSNTVLRDHTHKVDGIVFSTPVTKTDYLFGRFIGAFAAVLVAFTSVPLAMFIGSMMPWVDQETVGPNRLVDYLYMMFVIGMPNLLLSGMVMFSVANLTRSTMMTYLALIAFLVGWITSQAILQDPDIREFAALIDPFGAGAWAEMTRNWTAFERNEQLAPIEGLFLQNRLLWLTVSIALLIANFFMFSFRKSGASASRGKREKSLPQSRFLPTEITLPAVTRIFTAKTARQQFFARTWFEIRSVLFSITFWVLLGLGIMNTVGSLFFPNEVFGTPTLPVTKDYVQQILGSFVIVPIIVIAFYAGDMVWRDRGVKMHEIIDATPTPSWAFLFPKLLAIVVVVFALMGFAILTGITAQFVRGYTNFELGQYATRLLFLFSWPLVLTAILALFVQVVFNNRYLGYLILLIYLIAQLVMATMGFEHNLYNYGGTPGTPYSDLNGHGHFFGIALWFLAYWTCVGVVLLVLTYLLWNRGALTSIGRRIVDLPRSISGATGPVLALALIGAIGLGGWIFYNTNILNDYSTRKSREQASIDYEEKYRPLEGTAQPKIIDVNVNVDIFPYQRRYEVAGSYVLENRTDQTISKVHVEYNPQAEIINQNLAGAALDESDSAQNVYSFALTSPMQPGEKRTLNFNTKVEYKGFRNSGNGVDVVYNGTFINNSAAMPGIGYQPNRILTDRNIRRRYGLDPVDRMPKRDDESQYKTGFLRGDSDFVNFETIVSTADDQIAIAPGYLERDWTENGRHYFHYKMDAPIQNFFSFQSAKYTVKEDQWNDVKIQIFYHKPHEFNVDRMIYATKQSLDYFSKNFSPFQYRQMRILEFPYQSFAQSFPNTVPFSENIGFILDTTDPDRVDSVFYVTSHEVAHQWWGHQVSAALVQGATMLIESFAQYSAFMVVEKEFGEEHVRDFLKLELDRYLAARGSERIEELPLAFVENQQYIHYNKGSLIMYALKDYVGEDTVNRSLARLVDLRAYSADPYPTTIDFINILREEVGDDYQDLITDFFEKITLYDLQADDVEVAERNDGRFDVTFTYSAKKFYADGQGQQTETDIKLPIDIGVFKRSPADNDFEKTDVLYLEKHTINPENPVITITVDEKPEFAGIDPYVKLIDRDADNNVKRAS